MKPANKWLLSALIVFHLAAVFLPPLAFQARGPLGSSPSIESVVSPVRGYGEFLYLNRGYAFFAPDPGPSHLFQAAISSPTSELKEPIFPDLKRHWPRLLYHRHFMIAEFLNDAYQPRPPKERPADLDPREYRNWRTQRARYEAIRESLVDHLRAAHPGHEVAIRRLEHAIPSFVDFNENPVPLDDLRLYNVLLDSAEESDNEAPWLTPDSAIQLEGRDHPSGASEQAVRGGMMRRRDQP